MNKKQVIIGLVAGFLVIYLITSIVVQNKLSNLNKNLDTKMSEQVEKLVTIANVIGQGSQNTDIAKVISDCSADESTEYDTLLSSLDKGLSKSNLEKLSMLFKQCGDIASVRRSIMTNELKHEVDTLALLVETSALVGEDKAEQYNLSKWKELSEKEQFISDSFVKLVFEQGNIISTLMAGASSNSEEVKSIGASAQKIREVLNNATSEAYAVRAELIKS